MAANMLKLFKITIVIQDGIDTYWRRRNAITMQKLITDRKSI